MGIEYQSITMFKFLMLILITGIILLNIKHRKKLISTFGKIKFVLFNIVLLSDLVLLNINWQNYTPCVKAFFTLSMFFTFQYLFELIKNFEDKKIKKIIEDFSNIKNTN